MRGVYVLVSGLQMLSLVCGRQMDFQQGFREADLHAVAADYDAVRSELSLSFIRP